MKCVGTDRRSKVALKLYFKPVEMIYLEVHSSPYFLLSLDGLYVLRWFAYCEL